MRALAVHDQADMVAFTEWEAIRESYRDEWKEEHRAKKGGGTADDDFEQMQRKARLRKRD